MQPQVVSSACADYKLHAPKATAANKSIGVVRIGARSFVRGSGQCLLAKVGGAFDGVTIVAMGTISGIPRTGGIYFGDVDYL